MNIKFLNSFVSRWNKTTQSLNLYIYLNKVSQYKIFILKIISLFFFCNNYNLQNRERERNIA